MTACATALGLQGMFALFPTLLVGSFGDFDRNPAKADTHILRIDQGLNLEKLARVDDLADRVAGRRVSLNNVST
jgi:uncharacterized membrane protein YjjP (DUF1212 family)